MQNARRESLALSGHLRECEGCGAAIAELMHLAREKGRQEHHSDDSSTQHAVVMMGLAGILAVMILAGGFLSWSPQTTEAAVARIYQQIRPAVANIQVQSAGATGSGIVFDKDGYILTSYHVVRDAQDDQNIVVGLPGLAQVPSKLIGYDSVADVAVLQVDVPSDRLTVARFGDVDRVRVGDRAIAVGNPFGLSHTLTVGHISAMGRRFKSNDPYVPDIEGVLQTDAAMNPGNSGGPLLNASGHVIGINTRIESPSGGSAGLGFAIPSNTSLEVAREIIARGYVQRPFLGVSGRPIDSGLAQDLNLFVDQGLLVQQVHPNSPAAYAGLKAGGGLIPLAYGEMAEGVDVILSIDEQPVQNQSDLNRLVAQHAIGDRVTLGILRNGRQLVVEVTLTERLLNDSGGQILRAPTESRERQVAGGG